MAVCSRCRINPPQKGQRYCRQCRTTAERERYKTTKQAAGLKVLPLRIVEPTIEPENAAPIRTLEYPADATLRDQIVWYRKRFLELAGEAKHVGERANCFKLALAATLKAYEMNPEKPTRANGSSDEAAERIERLLSEDN